MAPHDRVWSDLASEVNDDLGTLTETTRKAESYLADAIALLAPLDETLRSAEEGLSLLRRLDALRDPKQQGDSDCELVKLSRNVNAAGARLAELRRHLAQAVPDGAITGPSGRPVRADAKRKALLDVVLSEPGREWSIKELVERTGYLPATVRAAMGWASQQGLVLRVRRGHFRASPSARRGGR